MEAGGAGEAELDHELLELLAEGLNDAGYEVRDGVVLTLPVRFTKENLKDDVIRPMMTAMYPDKTSTTQLTTKEVQAIYEQVDQVIASRTGVHVEWPSIESQRVESLTK